MASKLDLHFGGEQAMVSETLMYGPSKWSEVAMRLKVICIFQLKLRIFKSL